MEIPFCSNIEKRKSPRKFLDYPIPIALKSEFNRVVYRDFFMKDYSKTGALVEFFYNFDNPQYALFPVLIHKLQKNFSLYFNLLNYKDIASELNNVSTKIEQNLWLEIPTEIKRYEKKKNSFGLGLLFLK